MTADDIILRIAQAILDVHRRLDQSYLVNWEYLSPKQRALYLEMARAAVAAAQPPAPTQTAERT